MFASETGNVSLIHIAGGVYRGVLVKTRHCCYEELTVNEEGAGCQDNIVELLALSHKPYA